MKSPSMSCRTAASRSLLVLSALLTVGTLAPALRAQPTQTTPAQPTAPAERLPDARDLHAKYIKSLGGEATIMGLKTAASKAKIEVPAQQMTATLVLYQTDNAMYSATDIAGFGQVEAGLADGIAWQKNSMTGPQIMEGPERDEFLRENDLHAALHVDKHYTKMETTGVADVEGKKCYKVEFTPLAGEKEVRYYEDESGLVVRVDTIKEMQGNKFPVTMTISDYRDVDGFKAPFKMSQTMMQMSSTITFESIAYNKDVPAEKLKLPADVKALADKKKSGGDAPKTEPPKPEAPKTPTAPEPKKPDAPK